MGSEGLTGAFIQGKAGKGFSEEITILAAPEGFAEFYQEELPGGGELHYAT